MKYFTFIEVIQPNYQEILDHNKSIVDLTVFRKCPYDIQEGKDKRWRSDVARIMWMRDHPDWEWIDADCWIIKPIDFKTEKPMFLNCNGQPDIAVIMGNGDSSIFIEMLDAINGDVGWAQGWLDGHRNRISMIPHGYFDHRGLGLTRK
jgi:hypothetical protein